MSAMPLAIAAAACSRIPKWRLRPARSSGWKSPAPANVRRVLVDGARSADPPSSQARACAIALSTWPEESRLAMPFASAGNVGMSRVPAVRQLPALHPLDLVGELRVLGAVRVEQRLPCARAAPRRACRCPAAKCS